MPESEKTNDERKELTMEWMIRPCEMYNAEYKDCKSIRARFHQYFVFGETIDCTQWKTDYNNCWHWQKYNSQKAYNELIESEKTRRLKRLRGHYENNVWEKRDKPPENWNAPLPEWMVKRNETSYLKCISDKVKQEQDIKVQERSCTIM